MLRTGRRLRWAEVGLAVLVSAAACAQEDDPAPSLIEASIVDGASELDPAQLSMLELRFDRPLARDRGHARLQTALLDLELPLAWSADGLRASITFAGVLRSDRTYHLALESAVDPAGRAPEVRTLWPQGTLRFSTVRRDFTAPAVVDSTPRHLATDLYPAPVYEGGAPRIRISVTFDEGMHPEARQVSWGPAGQPRTPATATWSADARTLGFEIVAAPFSGKRPLEDRTVYQLDLSTLRDLAGNPATLDGQSALLEFTTGTYDALLNHSCGHVFFGPFSAVSASGARDLGAPRTDAAHTRYTINLPGGGATTGYTRLRASADATWHLFLDGDLEMSVVDSAGSALPSQKSPTPAACAGITHRMVFSLQELDQAFLVFGPTAVGSAKLIVEQLSAVATEPTP